MIAGAHVTIGVPVHRGEAHLAEALRGIQAQTHLDFDVIISLDGPQPAAESVSRAFLADPRFRLVIQPQRLGWVGHVNWLMAQVQAPFWYLNPQDDFVDPEYLATLVEKARRIPDAAVVYCDIEMFGLQEGRLVQASVEGSALARQLTLLHDHHAAVAFRGLTRIEALRHAGALRPNEVEDYSTDTVWMAAMARWGSLKRAPAALYHKRYHADNTHTRWSSWPSAKLARAWMIHCAHMVEQAMLVPASRRERYLLWFGAVERLISPRLLPVNLPDPGSRQAFTASLLEAFFVYLKAADFIDVSALLEAPWSMIEQRTREVMLPVAGDNSHGPNHG